MPKLSAFFGYWLVTRFRREEENILFYWIVLLNKTLWIELRLKISSKYFLKKVKCNFRENLANCPLSHFRNVGMTERAVAAKTIANFFAFVFSFTESRIVMKMMWRLKESSTTFCLDEELLKQIYVFSHLFQNCGNLKNFKKIWKTIKCFIYGKKVLRKKKNLGKTTNSSQNLWFFLNRILSFPSKY